LSPCFEAVRLNLILEAFDKAKGQVIHGGAAIFAEPDQCMLLGKYVLWATAFMVFTVATISMAYCSYLSRYELDGIFHKSDILNAIDAGVIPKCLEAAFIVAEDRNFYDKRNIFLSIAPISISPITMQLARRSLTAKGYISAIKFDIESWLMTFKIETAFSRKRIMLAYLDHVRLGGRVWGVQSAASQYFNKRLVDLDDAECAYIGGLAKDPERFTESEVDGRARRNWVIDRMADAGFIDSDSATKAKAKALPRTGSDRL
jgi:membrane peptidoglycan carboxypeptidase